MGFEGLGRSAENGVRNVAREAKHVLWTGPRESYERSRDPVGFVANVVGDGVLNVLGSTAKLTGKTLGFGMNVTRAALSRTVGEAVKIPFNAALAAPIIPMPGGRTGTLRDAGRAVDPRVINQRLRDPIPPFQPAPPSPPAPTA